MSGVATRLSELDACVSDEMADFIAELVLHQNVSRVVRRAVQDLLALRGKYLRPICVALASETGTGFGSEARDLAVAVELIHNATLLHDDVIDTADYRRGKPAARVVYGNAASILSGDWLLIQALKRVRRSVVPGVFELTLSTIEEIIAAETLQLGQRGKLDADRAAYFRVIQGKTAALFRLGMSCGAKAGGVSEDRCRALESYGAHLGIAFQLVDDLLDFTADACATGKALLADLREGKMTYPLLLSLERDHTLRSTMGKVLEEPSGTEAWASLAARVLETLHSKGGIRDCLALARERAADAIGSLRAIPEGPGRDALIDVAEAIVDRKS